MALSIYRRLDASNNPVRQAVNLAGIGVGAGSFTVSQATMRAVEMDPPLETDSIRDTAGVLWIVDSVAGPSSGNYTLTCSLG